MKRKSVGILVAAVAVAAIAGYNLYTAQNKDVELSDIALANVEALAQYEGGNTCSASATCYGIDGRVTGTVSCTGTTTCISEFHKVTCDYKSSYCQ